MTLNGVMAIILRYFSEFGQLPGHLRKSSRSLSHLLMSSCMFCFTQGWGIVSPNEVWLSQAEYTSYCKMTRKSVERWESLRDILKMILNTNKDGLSWKMLISK